MKTKTVLPILFTAIAFIACMNDQFTEIENDFLPSTIQKNWNETELSTTFYNNQSVLSHHHIDAEKLRNILQYKSVIKFRFILGLNKNQELEIEIAGIDQNGKVLTSFASITNTNNFLKTSINSLQYSTYRYSNTSGPTTHLLPYRTAYAYINKWEEAIQQKKQIEDLISYDGKRIRYFSLPKQVVLDMTASTNVNAVALFLGINIKNKLTTVFIQKTHQGNLLLKKENHYLGSTTNGNEDNGEGNIYDFTEPCPNLCDDE